MQPPVVFFFYLLCSKNKYLLCRSLAAHCHINRAYRHPIIGLTTTLCRALAEAVLLGNLFKYLSVVYFPNQPYVFLSAVITLLYYIITLKSKYTSAKCLPVRQISIYLS